MPLWSIRLSPTTTASFADLTLTPSYRLIGALALLYASALLLLALCVLRQTLPLPAFFAIAWWLIDEWGKRLVDVCNLVGRLQISGPGDIRWQGQVWTLRTVRIRTSQVLLWHLEGEGGRRWLPIFPDSCNHAGYRSLALYSHHYRAMSE